MEKGKVFRWPSPELDIGQPIGDVICQECGFPYKHHGWYDACPRPETAEAFIRAGEKPRRAEDVAFENAQKENPPPPAINPALALSLLSSVESHIRIFSELARSHDSTAKAGHSLEPIHCWDRGMHVGYANAARAYIRELQTIVDYFKPKIEGKEKP